MKKFILGVIIFVIVVLLIAFIVISIPSEEEKQLRRQIDEMSKAVKDENLEQCLQYFLDEFKSNGFTKQNLEVSLKDYFNAVDFKDIRIKKVRCKVTGKEATANGVAILEISESKMTHSLSDFAYFLSDASKLFTVGEHKVKFNLSFKKVERMWRVKEAKIKRLDG